MLPSCTWNLAVIIPDHFAIVKGDGLGTENLVSLMPFAGDENEVIGRSQRQGELNRRAAVHFTKILRPGLENSLFDIIDDLIGIFGPRIVRGCNRNIAQARND